MNEKPLVVISACLHGEAVRYDGGDKRLSHLQHLQEQLELLSLCPEHEAGLGTPRPPVQLVLTDKGLRAQGRDDPALDVTESLLEQRTRRYRVLLSRPLCGYVFKSRSPSCGLHSTPVHSEGFPLYFDNGLFADGLLQLMPWLAVCDEAALGSELRIHSFVRRCQLVNEVLYSQASLPLTTLHQRHREQQENLDNNEREELEALAYSNKRHEYLQALWEMQFPAAAWQPDASASSENYEVKFEEKG